MRALKIGVGQRIYDSIVTSCQEKSSAQIFTMFGSIPFLHPFAL